MHGRKSISQAVQRANRREARGWGMTGGWGVAAGRFGAAVRQRNSRPGARLETESGPRAFKARRKRSVILRRKTNGEPSGGTYNEHFPAAILRLGEESSLMPACGRALGFFAKPQNDRPGGHWQRSEESTWMLAVFSGAHVPLDSWPRSGGIRRTKGGRALSTPS